jgi:RHS repeat-associated protein
MDHFLGGRSSGTYDAQDRLLKYSTSQYLYTANGELSQKIEGIDTTKYVYDDFGNLMSVRIPNGDNIEYLIDGQNRRIGKKLNGNIVKRWIYSGQLSPIAELDSTGNVVAQFVGGYMIKNGNTYQLITDHLGSIRLVVDVNSGSIAQQIDYDEFGNVILNTNPDFQPFAYAGGLYDTQTKLVRFGARDYNADIGRWIKKDPIGFGGGNNLYGYTNDDPINYIDIAGFSFGSVFWRELPKNLQNVGNYESYAGDAIAVASGNPLIMELGEGINKAGGLTTALGSGINLVENFNFENGIQFATDIGSILLGGKVEKEINKYNPRLEGDMLKAISNTYIDVGSYLIGKYLDKSKPGGGSGSCP